MSPVLQILKTVYFNGLMHYRKMIKKDTSLSMIQLILSIPVEASKNGDCQFLRSHPRAARAHRCILTRSTERKNSRNYKEILADVFEISGADTVFYSLLTLWQNGVDGWRIVGEKTINSQSY